MTCLKLTPSAPTAVPALPTLLQPLASQAFRRFELVVVHTLDALCPDAFDAVVGTAPALAQARPDAAEIEYASWMPDPGAIEMASWATHLQHPVR
jgi:hypothetical protein